jgi:hypothetical protein
LDALVIAILHSSSFLLDGNIDVGILRFCEACGAYLRLVPLLREPAISSPTWSHCQSEGNGMTVVKNNYNNDIKQQASTTNTKTFTQCAIAKNFTLEH